MSNSKVSALLIRLPQGKGAALAAAAKNPLRAAGVSFDIEPLFTTATRGPGRKLGAAASGWEWHIARPGAAIADAHGWELAHESLVECARLAAGPESDIFIEPDLEQEWPYENPPGTEANALAAAEACVFNDQNNKLPRVDKSFAWHLGDGFSQLKTARTTAAATGRVVRIAHLDVGFDPGHSVLPQFLRGDLQRNFMDDQGPNDAHDPNKRGFMKNPGHGTGTMSILAGGKFKFNGQGYNFDDFIGGAPNAEIIPVRVGKSVVQIYTSGIAAGINYAAELCGSEATRVHVMSMSMGGVASQAWADAVNKAYECGIVYVCAGGNNYSGLPTRLIVYPARFRRVIAACGVMADFAAYYGLSIGTMQGNWGPESKMATAISAFTPNIPWAELGCANIVDMDGQGTSAATPQVAAAAALYLQHHGGKIFKYSQPWMRVEAVRNALFSSAKQMPNGAAKLGNGVLQAASALNVNPPAEAALRKSPEDDASFSFLHALIGLPAAEDARTRMLALEATQLSQRGPRDGENPFDVIIPDPDLPANKISDGQRRKYLEALYDHPEASRPLRKFVGNALGRTPAGPTPGRRVKVNAELPSAPQKKFVPPEPPFRELRGFALDPSLATDLNTVSISEVTFQVPWEELAPGPAGEYLEVVDFDPGSDCFYEPVNLDDPKLLAQDGLAPSEGVPQFHQQMVYAAASLTIQNFEHALGRRTLWRPGPPLNPRNPHDDSHFVQRLRIYPHALRERNAYYTPDKIALLFGYFKADSNAPGEHMAGGMVFSCLSHDIIAHETTHALLDGMNRCFLTPTNPDVHAFHEAFADIVALFQHFTFPEILRHQINATGGNVRTKENLLGQLAGQFGRGTGHRTALRDAIGRMEDGEWKPHVPEPGEYEKTFEPHQRGAILVAAVFDAYLSIYERRTGDLLRLATGGTGILQAGAIHPDLVHRLAAEAAKSAQHVLTMCVRALDYCPPVDITFGEYLRALITADYDLVPDDDLCYRTAFIQAFRRRALYPGDVRTLSVESLLWRTIDHDTIVPSAKLEEALVQLRSHANDRAYTQSRKDIFDLERAMRLQIHDWLKDHFATTDVGENDARYLGLNPKRSFEVRSARIAFRTSPDGGMIPQLLLSLLQRTEVPIDENDPNGAKMSFEGGSTLIADLRSCRIRYCIRKNATSGERLARQRAFALTASGVRATYFGASSFKTEPFAAIHRGL